MQGLGAHKSKTQNTPLSDKLTYIVSLPLHRTLLTPVHRHRNKTFLIIIYDLVHNWLLPVSQVAPVYCGGHTQLPSRPSISRIHVPPFRHGSLEQYPEYAEKQRSRFNNI